MKFYQALLPASQNEAIEVRQAEPYSYCQFIMGQDHTAFGRARNPWLTGSAGWMYHAVTHWMLGVRPDYAGLIVDPCIPAVWKEFEVRREWRGAAYQIKVANPHGVQKGVRLLSLNGHPVQGPIPPQPPGTLNEVLVEMG